MDKKYYKGINMYYIGYITIKKIDDCKSIYSVNPLYLQVNHANGYIEEKNGNKYLIFDDSVNENKELLKKYADVWGGIKSKINDTKENDCEKGYMKIKVDSDDDLTITQTTKISCSDHNYQVCFRRWWILSSSFFRWCFVWSINDRIR